MSDRIITARLMRGPLDGTEVTLTIDPGTDEYPTLREPWEACGVSYVAEYTPVVFWGSSGVVDYWHAGTSPLCRCEGK